MGCWLRGREKLSFCGVTQPVVTQWTLGFVMHRLSFPLLGLQGHCGQGHVARLGVLTTLSPYSELATSCILFPQHWSGVHAVFINSLVTQATITTSSSRIEKQYFSWLLAVVPTLILPSQALLSH